MYPCFIINKYCTYYYTLYSVVKCKNKQKKKLTTNEI